MNRIRMALAALGLFGLSASALALPTQYGSPGTVNLTTYTFTAASAGDIVAYFVGQSAGYGSDIGLSINGAAPITYGLQNHTVLPGASFNMGSVNAGDVLRFVLRVSVNDFYGPGVVDYTLNSDASLNPGGENYIYSYAYGGGDGFPAGTYIGFEDIRPLTNPANDLDYNDHQFLFTNVRVTQNVPDGGLTMLMLGTAFVCVGLLRRKL